MHSEIKLKIQFTTKKEAQTVTTLVACESVQGENIKKHI